MKASHRFTLLYLLLFVTASICGDRLHAQCSGGTAAGALAPAPAASWQTMGITTGNYYTFTVPAASGCSFPTYYFSFCSGDGGNAGFDTQITILDNTGAYANGYSDDYCGLQSWVQWTPTAAGTYRVLLNTYYCGAGSAATLAYRMVAAPPSNPYLAFVNDATAGATGCATLTAAVNGQRGCAWDNDNTLNMLAPFTYDFTIFLGASDAGADGMAFVIQNSPMGRCACGAPGGSLGAAGIPNSLIVEIDTYLNAEDRDDGMAGVVCTGGPEPDHLDIWLNGNINPAGGGCPTPAGARVIPAAIKLMNGASDYNIENGLNHLFRVSWVPGSPGTLTFRIYDNAGVTLYGTVSYAFTPMALFGTNTPFFGFTASTGGLNNLQSFCEPPALVLAAEDLQLTAAQSGDAVHLAWVAPEGFGISQVERSVDGLQWQELLSMPRISSSPTQEALDRSPMGGANFYRVHMRDIDGRRKTSNVVDITMPDSDQLIVYPNPVAGELTVQLPAGASAAAVTLTDVQGRIVHSAVCAQGNAKISTTHLSSGIYQLTVVTAQKSYHHKVVVR